jgi:hypothetical protein
MVHRSLSQRSRSRGMAGGDGGATGWGQTIHGSGADQTARYNAGGSYTPTSGYAGLIGAPSSSQLAHIQSAGGRRRSSRRSRRRSRKQRGGMWGALLEQAAVPLTLLGLQQTFRRRHRK